MWNQNVGVKAPPPGSAVDAQDQPGRAVKRLLGLVGILLVPRAWLADPDMSGPSLSRGHTCCSERPQTAGCKEVLASELGPAAEAPRTSHPGWPGTAADEGALLEACAVVRWPLSAPLVGEDRTASCPDRILGSGQESLSASLQSL